MKINDYLHLHVNSPKVFYFTKTQEFVMQNKILSKKLIYPWDVGGYVKISQVDKELIINFIRNDKSKIKDFPTGWFYNFIKSEKIKAKWLMKIKEIYNLALGEYKILRGNK